MLKSSSALPITVLALEATVFSKCPSNYLCEGKSDGGRPEDQQEAAPGRRPGKQRKRPEKTGKPQDWLVWVCAFEGHGILIRCYNYLAPTLSELEEQMMPGSRLRQARE